MSRQWFPHYVGDYMRDTGHLTLVEDGAYRRLLDYYYSSGKPLPSDKSKLWRICRAFDEDEKAAIETVLDQFFTLKSGVYHNKRADDELKKADSVSSKNSENARKRWDKERNASAVRPHVRSECLKDASTTTTTSTTTPTTKTTKKRTSVVLIDEQISTLTPKRQESVRLWLEYKAERKEKYKPIGFRAFLKKWSNVSDADFEKIVEKSMSSNYSGLFELDGNRSPTQSGPSGRIKVSASQNPEDYKL